MSSSCRLGVLIPYSKKQKIKLPNRILDLCEKENITVDEVNSEEELYARGPYNILLHKITDYCNELPSGEASSKIQRIREYCVRYPGMKLIDPFEWSEKLTDRFHQTKLMRSCETVVDDVKVFVPKIVEIPEHSTLEETKDLIALHGVRYPLMVKPAVASVTEYSHQMRLVFTHDHLKDLTYPCVIQQFCNHGGVVYKIYIIGEHVFVCERPSIQDVDYLSGVSLSFDTRNISKLGRSFNPELHGSDPNKRRWLTCNENPDLLNRKVVAEISRLIKKSTNLTLLGIDVLIEKETGNYALIDVNHFPGYSGIDENLINQAFIDLIKESY